MATVRDLIVISATATLAMIVILSMMTPTNASPVKYDSDVIIFVRNDEDTTPTRPPTIAFPREKVCKLPAVRGHCRALLPRWRYDPKTHRCHEFKFGGCDGNGNNFITEKECMKACHGI